MTRASQRKPKNPDEGALRELALTFPEVTEEFPWDHRALKVRGKVFVFMGTGKDGGASHDDFFISCKLPISGALALTLDGVKPTRYGLGKAGWVSAQFPPGKAPVYMLMEWIRESYCAIAPKKLVAELESGAGKPQKPTKKKGSSKTTKRNTKTTNKASASKTRPAGATAKANASKARRSKTAEPRAKARTRQ